MKAFITTLIISLFFFSSCGYKSSEYKALQAQNDSLLRAKGQMQEEIDGYFTSMNHWENQRSTRIID